MEPTLRDAARDAIGFMPEDEGLALYRAGLLAARVGPLLEIGSYCGKSAVYLGGAARVRGTVLYSIDHHRGSEEHQHGQEYHDPRLVDEATGRIDTLPQFTATVRGAGLAGVVLPIVARSEELGRAWREPLGLVFIDGGHAQTQVASDYETWARHVRTGGLLAIHDVFVDPAAGGRAPFEAYRRALDTGAFEEISATGSLRILQRVRNDV
ncbi:MAG: class I SAM-dependent methyltransferase [Actinomycetota bacterium]